MSIAFDSFDYITDLEIGDFYASGTNLEFDLEWDTGEIARMTLRRWHLGRMAMNRAELVMAIGEAGVRKVEEHATETWYEAQGIAA